MIQVFYLPVLVDPAVLRKRLTLEERSLVLRLAELENRIRKFEDFELPAYEAWLRIEMGPALMNLEEIFQKIYERRIFVQRINELLETKKLNPREALFIALHKHEWVDPERDQGRSKGGTQTHQASGSGASSWNADEIDARRQAKREAKRAARRETKVRESNQRRENGEGDRVGQRNGQRDGRQGGKTSKISPQATNQGPTRGASRLVSLYRALARKLHPDSHLSIKGLPASRVLALWLEVQSAYNSANMERLLAIAAWLGEGTEGAEDGDLLAMSSSVLTFSERFERIRSMTRSSARLEVKLAGLVKHPAWKFESIHGKLRRKLRQKVARDLEDETARAQEVLDALDEFVDSIGTPKAPHDKVYKR